MEQESYTNAEMEQMVGALSKHLGRVDLIGYAAARNTRALGDEIGDYIAIRDELVMKYGEPDMDEDGTPLGTTSVSPGCAGFAEFVAELAQFASIEASPRLFKIPYAEAIGKLSGAELLEIEWMFEE